MTTTIQSLTAREVRGAIERLEDESRAARGRGTLTIARAVEIAHDLRELRAQYAELTRWKEPRS